MPAIVNIVFMCTDNCFSLLQSNTFEFFKGLCQFLLLMFDWYLWLFICISICVTCICAMPGRGDTNTDKIFLLPLKSELSTSSQLISLDEK